MKKIFFVLLCLAVILSACSLPTLSPPPSTPVTNQPPFTPRYEDCGWQWAQKALPELSKNFQASIQVLQSQAQATAYAYGENCMLADGNVGRFSAMETDFNITLPISDLTNESDLGGWIVDVMQVIENIPKEKIEGPQPGRVTITFQSGSNQKTVNFYTNQYQALPRGLSNSEIFQKLQIPRN